MTGKHKQTPFDYVQGKNTPLKRKVFVGLSGGVDSSVSAYLLKQQGYDVRAVFMLNWKEKGACDWEEDLRHARSVAKKLSIPLQIWDFAKEYREFVFEDFILAYKKGLTPNPDVFCNKYIKFGSFYDRAIREGADFVATGHYARIQELGVKNQELGLFSAVDKTKDQSDFLYQIKQSQLKRIQFPVGGMLKMDVKKRARKIGLPNWNKPESMGVCFIGELNMKKFLQKYITPKHGVIVDTKGKKLGDHDGIWYYTLGQREGLNVGGTGPYFVVGKDIRRNILTVAREPEAGKSLMVRKVELSKVNFFSQMSFPRKRESKQENQNKQTENSFGFLDSRSKPGMTTMGAHILWRDRHLSTLEKGMLKKKNGKWAVEFDSPKRSVTPGQSLVLYDLKGERVVGGGVVTHVQ